MASLTKARESLHRPNLFGSSSVGSKTQNDAMLVCHTGVTQSVNTAHLLLPNQVALAQFAQNKSKQNAL